MGIRPTGALHALGAQFETLSRPSRTRHHTLAEGRRRDLWLVRVNCCGFSDDRAIMVLQTVRDERV